MEKALSVIASLLLAVQLSAQTMLVIVAGTGNGSSSITRVQTSSGEATGAGNGIISSAAATTTTGNTLVIGVTWYNDPGQTILSMADGGLDSFAQCPSAYQGGGVNFSGSDIWYAPNITGHTANSVIATFTSNTNFPSIWVVELHGANATSPCEVVWQNHVVGPGTSVTSEPVRLPRAPITTTCVSPQIARAVAHGAAGVVGTFLGESGFVVHTALEGTHHSALGLSGTGSINYSVSVSDMEISCASFKP